MKLFLLTQAFVALIGLAAAAAPIAPAVQYFPAESVREAFDRGAVLLRQGNYMIHTSRRTAPGLGEVHTKDNDLIYVLEGSATFVTGGKLVKPKTTEPGEIRGTGIEGGETRTLVPGDVIVVPRDTPHWFKAVEGTVLYYTVKVR